MTGGAVETKEEGMTIQYIVFDPEGLAEKQNQAVQSWYRGREYGSCRVLRWDRTLVYKKTKGCRVLGGVQSTSVVRYLLIRSDTSSGRFFREKYLLN